MKFKRSGAKGCGPEKSGFDPPGEPMFYTKGKRVLRSKTSHKS